MTPKATSHVIQGMQKDTSKSKLSKEFAFDAKNIRITAREDNTLLTITNEKGTKSLKPLFGYYLGHCVLNNQLVLFTTVGEGKDFIFLYDSEFNRTTLYSGNLNFSLDNPLETLGVYENEDIQKVYWVDGRNQPRVINIKASEYIRNKWSDSSFDFIPELALQESVSVEAISNSSLFAPGVIQYAFSYYNKYGQESNIFDVTPLCYLAYNNRGANPEEIIRDRAFKIKVDNVDTTFDYIRIYSIHRTSLNATPTVKRIIDLPISIPEETTEIKESVSSYNIANNYTIGYYSTGFKYPFDISKIEAYNEIIGNITETTYSFSKSITPVDYNNQYLILYDENTVEKERIKVIGATFYIKTEKVILPGSNREIIQKTLTSKNTDTTFITTKIQYNNTVPSIEYIDNGTLGETIDPTQLLYIGGEDIIAGTITQKDGTLFLGNIKLKQLSIPKEIKNDLKNSGIDVISTARISKINNLNNNYNKGTYVNTDSYYRAGEHYRLGIQFQYKNGKWSEPVYITDKTQSIDNRPIIENEVLQLPSFSFTLSNNINFKLLALGFLKMRGIVVFPESYERKVLAQGMLCPTVFNNDYRRLNIPYAQSSWFIRPNLHFDVSENEFSFNENAENILEGASVEFRHNRKLITGENRGSEIQNNSDFRVDQSILTFHSPDLEFEYNGNKDLDIQLRIVGIIPFSSNYGDIDIQTKTPPISDKAEGFIHRILKNNTGIGSLVSGLFYEDEIYPKEIYENSTTISVKSFLVYPWHNIGSLNIDDASIAESKNRIQSALLQKKKISNFKHSKNNIWLNKGDIWEALGGNSTNSYSNGISKIELANSEQVELIKLDNKYNYYNNIDFLLTSETPYNLFAGTSTTHQFTDKLGKVQESGSSITADYVERNNPVRMKYKSSKHIILKLNRSLHGDDIVLPTICRADSDNNLTPINSINGESAGLFIEEDNTYYNITVAKYKQEYNDRPENADNGDILIPCRPDWTFKWGYLYIWEDGYWKVYYGIDDGREELVGYYNTDYKLELYKRSYPGTSSARWEYYKTVSYKNAEIESVEKVIRQDIIPITSDFPYLFLSELYVNSAFIQNAFGGNTEEAIKNNLWLPASQSVPINTGNITYEYGDTRYQRYDCLKTYAFTPEDENQVVEIASFMCETRVNMLGRYDKNIGNLSNLNADPTNFNLFNPVYSQKDNFFNYRILDSDMYKLDKFTNTVTWSKEKHLGEDVDTWTNITMASTLDLDGTKGKVNKLLTFKDQIFAFQDKGISNILFNSRVQIPVSDGVPVEISNGMKVDGSRYISDNIGCQNKNSIITTPSGVYFLDSESNGIYLLAEGLTNLSTNKGFDIWTKEVSKDPSFKSFYDKNEKDVYFTTKDYCLGYSEKLGQFTSFYDYNDVETMFNIGTGFYSIKANSRGDQSIYQHSVGNYNEFYGEIKPYHLTIISNDDPQVDKVFTNLDYRADFFDSKNNYLENDSFDTIEVWNEYQGGKETLKYSKFRPSNLKKKFRMWGANIPRDKKNKLDRMRNPWLYIKLSKENPGTSKMELHDLVVKYLE